MAPHISHEDRRSFRHTQIYCILPPVLVQEFPEHVEIMKASGPREVRQDFTKSQPPHAKPAANVMDIEFRARP